MSLTAKDVAEITRLLEESSFDELDLEIDGMKLRLRRGGMDCRPEGRPTENPDDDACRSGFSPTNSSPAVETPTPPTDPDLHNVTAPLLGTFYRAPKPGAPPFVETGARVDEDTIIGIIEVMKLMNTVRAGVRGTIEQILAQDGALVEYGDTLLRVRRG